MPKTANFILFILMVVIGTLIFSLMGYTAHVPTVILMSIFWTLNSVLDAFTQRD